MIDADRHGDRRRPGPTRTRSGSTARGPSTLPREASTGYTKSPAATSIFTQRDSEAPRAGSSTCEPMVAGSCAQVYRRPGDRGAPAYRLGPVPRRSSYRRPSPRCCDPQPRRPPAPGAGYRHPSVTTTGAAPAHDRDARPPRRALRRSTPHRPPMRDDVDRETGEVRRRPRRRAAQQELRDQRHDRLRRAPDALYVFSSAWPGLAANRVYRPDELAMRARGDEPVDAESDLGPSLDDLEPAAPPRARPRPAAPRPSAHDRR